MREDHKDRATLLATIIALLAVIAAIASLPGCKSATPATTASTDTKVQTHTEIIHTIDTVFVDIPHQSAAITTLDSVSRLENDYCVSWASIDAGLLHHSLETKDAAVAVPVARTTIYKDSIIERETEVKVPEPYEVKVPRELTAWQRMQMNGFWLVIAAIAVYLAIAHRKSLLAFIGRIFS